MFCQQVDDAALALIAPIDSSYCGQHNTSVPFFFLVHDGLHLGGQTVDVDESGGLALHHFTILLDFPLAISDCSAIIRAEAECVKRIFHMTAM